MVKTVIEEAIERTMKELRETAKPQSNSRTWTSSQGYKFLVQWSNLVLLRIMIRKFTATLPKSEYRSKAQVDDASRSTVANVEEGFKRATTQEYIQFISYSQGSLEEVHGDVERFYQDGFIKSRPGSTLKELGIDLQKWNNWLRIPTNAAKILDFPLDFDKGIYRNLKEITGADFTYEMYIELINKTDWLLRKLVQSLEIKQNQDKLKL